MVSNLLIENYDFLKTNDLMMIPRYTLYCYKFYKIWIEQVHEECGQK